MPPCDRLRKFRNLLGMTQVELANKVNMNPEEISKLESGARDPLSLSVRLAKDIARALGKTLNDVFGEPGKGK